MWEKVRTNELAVRIPMLEKRTSMLPMPESNSMMEMVRTEAVGACFDGHG